jgi:hypothetical protein
MYQTDLTETQWQYIQKVLHIQMRKLLCLLWTLVGTGAPVPCRWAFPER